MAAPAPPATAQARPPLTEQSPTAPDSQITDAPAGVAEPPPAVTATDTGTTSALPAPDDAMTLPDWFWWAVGAAAVALLWMLGWAVFSRRAARRRNHTWNDTGDEASPVMRENSDADPVAPSPPATLGRIAATPDNPPIPSGAAAAPIEGAPLLVEAQAVWLGRSFANATLSYSVTLTNQGETPIRNLAVAADMTTAHGSVPVEDQLADTNTPLPGLVTIEEITAGGAKQARSEFRLPLAEVRTIRQGKAQLYIPLLRLRVTGDGMEPVLHTFVVGLRQPGRSARLLPFRLDEMAQTYRNVGLRALA